MITITVFWLLSAVFVVAVLSVVKAESSLDRLEAATWARWSPPPQLTVSEWADLHRVLSPEASAEPGRWQTSRVPYLRGVMDAVNDPHVETIVFLKGSQLGATESLVNVLGYTLACDPGPAMFIMPTLEMALSFSKDRFAPAVRDTTVLRELVGEPRSRDGDNTLLRKGVAGAVLTISGANSPASLSSRPVRLLFADEIDRWPATIGAEGDPLSLAIRRTTAFRRRKIILVSTPTVKGASRIEDWWEVSDKRLNYTPCARCREPFVIEWPQIRWTAGDPSTAHVECPSCRAQLGDAERHAMITAGQWRATAPFAGIAGFRAWEVVAPWRRLADLVASFLVAKRSIETLRVWRNTCVAELWEEPGESVEPSHLLLRRESYAAEVPAGVVCLVAGVDTQDDRLEVLVLGVGVGEETWVIARESLPGDPSRPEVWEQLDELLNRAWAHELGLDIRILCCCIDSAGHRTQYVYAYVIPRQGRRVHATIGRSGGTHGQLVSPPKPIRPASGSGTVLLRTVDTDQAKSLIMSRLRLSERAGPEVIHFPMAVGEQFFSELTAERLITKRNKFGVPTKVWERTRARNESLDAMGLCLGALRLVATPATLEQWAQHIAQTVAARAHPSGDDDGAPPPAAPSAPTAPARSVGRRVARSAYLQSWRD